MKSFRDKVKVRDGLESQELGAKRNQGNINIQQSTGKEDPAEEQQPNKDSPTYG